MECMSRCISLERTGAHICMYLRTLFLFICICYGEGYESCRQVGRFRLCEIPIDVPPMPYDRGDPVDMNFSSPSTTLLDNPGSDRSHNSRQAARQSSSTFSASIVGSASSAHKNAVNFCMELAEKNWVSDVGVTVKVSFSDLGDTLILGTAQPSRNWIVNNYICPVALAEAVVQEELNSGNSGDAKFDILMTLNSRANWYLGTDANPPSSQYDLVTVCLHEVYHGLFMSGGNIGISINQADLSYSAIFLRETASGRFDSFMANQDGCNITAYKDNPSNLGTVLTGNNLWFVSESERIGKLYAPRPYTPGSSLYHLSEADYAEDGDNNDLMTPAIGSRYGQHNPGPIIQRIQDLILDFEGRPGADSCTAVNPPEIDDTPIDQGSGDGSDPSKSNEGEASGFTVKIGETTVSGWVLIGAAAGAVVAILLVSFTIRAVLSSKRKNSARKERPRRRVMDTVIFADGGNEGSIV